MGGGCNYRSKQGDVFVSDWSTGRRPLSSGTCLSFVSQLLLFFFFNFHGDHYAHLRCNERGLHIVINYECHSGLIIAIITQLCEQPPTLNPQLKPGFNPTHTDPSTPTHTHTHRYLVIGDERLTGKLYTCNNGQRRRRKNRQGEIRGGVSHPNQLLSGSTCGLHMLLMRRGLSGEERRDEEMSEAARLISCHGSPGRD